MIETFYFGPAKTSLYGVYNAPSAAKDNSHGVVLCYPFGQEYIRVHRSFQLLARRLSDAGFHVMRFDFYGSGDSFGRSEEVSIAQWIKDINFAVEELEDNADFDEVSLVGLRLGASVAALAAAREERFANLILWEPVISGAEYLAELTGMQQKWLKDQLAQPAADKRAINGMESIGFPVPQQLQEELRRLNLLGIKAQISGNALILARDSYGGLKELLEGTLLQKKDSAELRVQHGPAVWLREERLENTLVPKESLDTIIHWLSEQLK
ncbi:MAG: serine aminopeptidase domain-containing protein [Calditrichia bacterium]